MLWPLSSKETHGKLGMVNSKFETLEDGKTSNIFFYNPKTFLALQKKPNLWYGFKQKFKIAIWDLWSLTNIFQDVFFESAESAVLSYEITKKLQRWKLTCKLGYEITKM